MNQIIKEVIRSKNYEVIEYIEGHYSSHSIEKKIQFGE